MLRIDGSFMIDKEINWWLDGYCPIFFISLFIYSFIMDKPHQKFDHQRNYEKKPKVKYVAKDELP